MYEPISMELNMHGFIMTSKLIIVQFNLEFCSKLVTIFKFQIKIITAFMNPFEKNMLPSPNPP